MSRISFIHFVRRISVASSPPPPPPPTQPELLDRLTGSLLKKSENLMTKYENFIGIKQVKEAHARVLQSETEFIKAQEDRRQAQILMNSMQIKVREVRNDLDRTPRGDENYLELVKREIELIREERALKRTFEREERRERELFHTLSNALRYSHEKERAQTEKTKYWSILASLIGASIGIVGTTINSQLKLRKLRQMLTENTEASSSAVLEKLEQLASRTELSAKLLTEFENLRQVVISDKHPPSADNSYPNDGGLAGNFEQIIKEEGDKRRGELMLAAVSIILLVPILILKFSSS